MVSPRFLVASRPRRATSQPGARESVAERERSEDSEESWYSEYQPEVATASRAPFGNSGAEYVAKGSLIQSGTTYYSVPFARYANGSATDTVFSTAAQVSSDVDRYMTLTPRSTAGFARFAVRSTAAPVS
jgi:hypothetical protein